MPQNYTVNVTQFGAYKAGDVIPGYEAAAGHDLAFLVERGVVTPTDAPASVEVVPRPAAAAIAPDDIVFERNRLAQDNARLTQDNAQLAGRAAELERHRDALKAELGRYVEQAAHLAAACDDHQAARTRLEADLAAATELLAAKGDK